MDTSWVSQESVPRASQQKGVQNHLLATLTLFYLVNISRHAREEVRASHYSQVPQDKCNTHQDYHEGGGLTTSLVQKSIKQEGKVLLGAHGVASMTLFPEVLPPPLRVQRELTALKAF